MKLLTEYSKAIMLILSAVTLACLLAGYLTIAIYWMCKHLAILQRQKEHEKQPKKISIIKIDEPIDTKN